MNLATLNDLFGNFSSQTLTSFTKNNLAYANESYIVTTDRNHKYVIKVLKTQGAESASVEALIQQKVYDAGIVTPRYIPLRNGDIVGRVRGINFTVSEYITGGRDTVSSPKLFLSMGSVMAKIHQSLDGVSIPVNRAQWLAQENVKRDLQEYTGALKAELTGALNAALSFLRHALPASGIHGDFTLSNIFTTKDSVAAVFDFETAENAPRILDIARTFLSLRRKVEYPAEVVLAKLIEGYRSTAQLPLTRVEFECLEGAINYTAAACAIWCANHDQEDAAKKYMLLAKETNGVVNNTRIPR